MVYFLFNLYNIQYFKINCFSDLTPANKSILESVLEFVLDFKQATNPYALIQASEVEEIRAHVCKICKYLLSHNYEIQLIYYVVLKLYKTLI